MFMLNLNTNIIIKNIKALKVANKNKNIDFIKDIYSATYI